MKTSVILLCAVLMSCIAGGCGSGENNLLSAAIQTEENSAQNASEVDATDLEVIDDMNINIKSGDNTITFKLNGSQAAKDLYSQLPLTVKVENFSTNEKVFYPPEELSTANTPMANAVRGTLAYYAPWGDVVMFYDDFGKGSGLYELGQVVSGISSIEDLSGTIVVTVVE